MIETVLVANRGEIARRVFRTCRDLGVGTVAVFSDADAGAPHVREADRAVRLPGETPADTYLRGDLIVRAAVAAGADAVHPGYGFLSENAAFARAVQEAGLTWVGPPPEAIEAMGSKVAAKKLMADAGVPVLPELDPDAVTEADLPILVKASAGGGGRGMRVVRALAELPDAVAGAAREAQSAFGDPTVFCEPLLESGARHIEVQILADRHGTVWTLGERECSIQRRHQKILEEAPSPAVDPDLRERLCRAAADAARAIGYVGAGTVEFLLGPDGRFFFLEVNTRLQVEHPVTECIYGIDLVRHQIEVAEGARLDPEPPRPHGHAIEVRLYAEDPAQDWRPSSGTLHTFEIPGTDERFAVPASYGLRVDSGVESGGEVGVHYDPMLAKLIAWAPTRKAAARRLAAALRTARIHGLTTNRELLARILTEPDFLEGRTDTAYLERHPDLTKPLADAEAVRLSALAAALADAAANRENAPVLRHLPSGWRNVPSQPQRKSYETPRQKIDVAYRFTRDGLRAEGRPDVVCVDAAPGTVTLESAGVRRDFTVHRAGDAVHVDSDLGPVTLRAVPRFVDPSARIAPGSLVAPMPGTVVRVEVEQGATVTEGQPLVVLEAMKMEHRITAPAPGIVTELNVSEGRQVQAGAVLAVIEQENPQ
ncbi:ATP-binding protein [Thermomonospora cellulosilytica]|uniref:Propionyl-CoA carboxylase alpha chain n=1 Tax=Thermomonospora cellulosilytica TaxID=1411118 RepID=A0A7W3N082_9ACTN|nr:biotin carboxylase N-terminal domain-containing protein [Thermomonospora cellulosilytica]MBA9005157.1 propionyl-CoA carboxylase alpha chain [Thermomonospora cellulosilytica]